MTYGVNVTDPEEASAVRKPLPLWVGLYGLVVVTLLFANGYNAFGDTTTRGWLVTVATAFELSGVVLIASPELRPLIERAAANAWRAVRRFIKAAWLRLRRLLGIPTPHRITLGHAVETSAALDLEVSRGGEPPPSTATLDEKVAYLLVQERRHNKLLEDIENLVRRETGAIRSELSTATADLREHTSVSVREAAEAELQMRLLGVAFVIAGISAAYVASLV
jgi:hypothetical protein